MLIAKLVDLYDKLLASGADIPPYPYGRWPTSYMVDLNKDGSIKEIKNICYEKTFKTKNGKEKTEILKADLMVPFHPGRSSEKRHFAFCDTTDYLFAAGERLKNPDSEKKKKASIEKFLTARQLMHDMLDGAVGDAANAILNFFDNWDCEHIEDLDIVQKHHDYFEGNSSEGEAKNSSIFSVLAYGGEPVTEDTECRKLYERYIDEHGYSDSTSYGMDIITGEQNIRICRVHPAVKNIPTCKGASGTGARLCCSNNQSSNFDDNEQGNNFPMSEKTAFKYTAALAYLANDRQKHCFVEPYNNITVLCWSNDSNEQQDQMMYDLLASDMRDEAGNVIPTIAGEGKTAPTNVNYLNYLRDTFKGYLADEKKLADKDPVYTVIGLDSRDGSIIRVKFEREGTLSQFAKNVIRYYEDTKIAGNKRTATPYRIINDCVPPKSKSKENTEKISNITRKRYDRLIDSVVDGKKFSDELIINTVNHIRSEVTKHGSSGITPMVASFSKAVLIRNYERSINVTVDETNDSMAYLYGRALSMGEQLQFKALGKRGTPLSARFLPMMMTRPNQAMSNVNVKVEYYLKKIRREKPALGITLTKKWTVMQSMLNSDEFGHKFTPEDQMLLCLGFYQENQAYFERLAAAKAEKEKQEAAKKATSQEDYSEKVLDVYTDELATIPLS